MASIKSAAIIHDGKPWIGYRHHLIMLDILEACGEEVAPILGEQGFVTDDGRFIDREEAADIAFKAGQIAKQKKTLFSEDVFKSCDCRFHGQFVEGVCNECGLHE